MSRLVEEPDGTVRLYIGAENWPLPIPLVNQNGAWYFDTGAGKEEILFRRIGRNEIAAMRFCQELVDAQKEYYAEALDGGVNQYAKKFVSDEGKHNDLYWKTGRGESESPIGPYLAELNNSMYRDKDRRYRSVAFAKRGDDSKFCANGYRSLLALFLRCPRTFSLGAKLVSSGSMVGA